MGESNPSAATTATSHFAGYCAELERLASTLTGMLSQALTLGAPLGADRPILERLAPVITNLSTTITASLNSKDGPLQDEAPAVRTSGARMIDWSQPADQAPPLTTPQSATVTPAEPEPAEENMPSLERCAELLMDDLSRETTDATAADGCGEVTLQGTNESLPLPSVFKFLGQTKKSGTLRVKTNDERLAFEIVDGNLVFSSTDNPPKNQLLGAVLVDLGYVTPIALEEFLERHDDKTRLGDALEREELVSKDDLRAALEFQIKNRLYRAFHATESAFTFTEGGPRCPNERIGVNVIQLLLEK